MTRWPWQRAVPRTSGTPPSANGASSFHLRWDFNGSQESASVDLTIVTPPSVARLYFWAIQADFGSDHGQRAGGAHFGLQWHPAHPHNHAVNWGGYHANGRELGGSVSSLESATGNPNTRDFDWQPGRPYRLTISRAESANAPNGLRAWRATVEDVDSGDITVVRDLYVPAEQIVGVLVWSEVFARCDDPSTEIRWSNAQVVGPSGNITFPRRALVNYQSHADGGCANTCSSSSELGLVQRTNTDRTVTQGTMLAWPGASNDNASRSE